MPSENKKKYNEQYYQKNKEKLDTLFKEYYRKNKNKLQEKNKKYYLENRERLKEYQKQYYTKNIEKILEQKSQYGFLNKRKIAEKKKVYRNNKYKINLKYNLSNRMARVIRLSLNGNKSGHHWEDLVGYTLEKLIKRLKFTMPKGYAWKDFLNGKLHIDHIIPVRAFVFNTSGDEEFKQCWSLKNLRLLTKEENISKGDSITNPMLLGLLIKGENAYVS